MRNKYIRFFISSTFADMKVERDLLQEVFNEIIPKYHQKGWHIETVDLRWGISMEAGYHNKTMQICKQELLRCQKLSPKPNFIILLGNRYGWIPLPEIISLCDYEKLKMDRDEKKLFDEWYSLDSNALPKGQYLLKPRIKEFRKDDTWKELAEKPLKELLYRNTKSNTTFFQRLFANRQSLVLQDFGLSATEQEIRLGALNVDDAGEHVVAYFRNLTDIPIEKQRDFVESNKGSAKQLTDLKKKLRDKLANNNIYSVSLSYNNYQQESFAQSFKQQMRNRITKIIDQTIEDCSQNTKNSENSLHLAIAAEEADCFVGREAELDYIDNFLRTSNAYHALWIKSPSGAGKSALLAKVVENYKNEFQIICRFCGRSIESSSSTSLLRSICWDLQQCDSKKCKEIKKYMDFPGHSHKPWECIKCRLEKFESDNPTIVVIDAINQVEEDTDCFSLLKWLDCQLSPSVKVIISSTNEIRYSFLPKHITIYPLHDMRCDAWSQIQKQLNRHGRELTQKQKEQIISIIEQSDFSAIYLDVLGKYLCSATSFSDLSNIPYTLTALVGHLLDNLSRVENHGPMIVRKVMSLLVSDRIGLSQTEILDLLSLDDEFYNIVKADSHHELSQSGERRIPPIIWSRLQSDISPFLRHFTTKAGQLLNVFHSELRQAIANNYLITQKDLSNTFQSLYQYYRSQINREDCPPHALLEVVYCGVKLMSFTRKNDHKTFQSTGIDIYHLLTDNAKFLTLKALHHTESLMNDYLLAMPYFEIKEQQVLMSVQREIMKAVNLTVINDNNGLIRHSSWQINEEHFVCYLRNLPSMMPIRKSIENRVNIGSIMENTLADSKLDKDDGTILVIPELGKMPRMSANGTKVASLFENNYQIRLIDLREPLNFKKINVIYKILDMHFSHDMHYAAIRTEKSYHCYDTVDNKVLFEGRLSIHGDISLSADASIMVVINTGVMMVLDIHGKLLYKCTNLLCCKVSPSGNYIWYINEDYELHRYNIHNCEDLGVTTFDPEKIRKRINYNNNEKEELDLCQTLIEACSDTHCAVELKDDICSVELQETSNSYGLRYFHTGYLTYGVNNDFLCGKNYYSKFTFNDKDNKSQSLKLDIAWSCVSPDLSLVLSDVEGDKFARIVDVRKVKQHFNTKSTGNNGVNSLTCSNDGLKIYVAYGFNFFMDHQEAIVRVVDGKMTSWIPPIGKDYQYITQVSSSPDGTLLALSIQHYLNSGGCEFMVITPDNKTIIRQNTGSFSAIGIAFSEDGRYILAKTGHLVNLPEPIVFLFNRQGKKIYENHETKNFSSDDFVCFSHNNRFVFDGWGNYADLLDSTMTTKSGTNNPYTIVPLGMMAIRFKHFLVQPPVSNGFLSSEKGGNIFFTHLKSNKRSVFKLIAPNQPIACSPSGCFVYLHNKGELSIWDWIGTQQIIKLMDHVQWIVPALDDNHIYVIRDDYMILLLNVAKNQVEQKAFMGRTIFQKACAQGLAVTNDYCDVALFRPDSSLKVNIPAPTTFVRHWDLEQQKLLSPVAVCPACGHHISLSKEIAKVLRPAPDNFDDIHRSDWDDSRLYGKRCPHCHAILSVNPYIL